MNRPSETITAATGSILAAVAAILIAYGVEIPDGVMVAATTLVAWIAAGVTWFVSRKQAAGTLLSDGTGKVVKPE